MQLSQNSLIAVANACRSSQALRLSGPLFTHYKYIMQKTEVHALLTQCFDGGLIRKRESEKTPATRCIIQTIDSTNTTMDICITGQHTRQLALRYTGNTAGLTPNGTTRLLVALVVFKLLSSMSFCKLLRSSLELHTI